MSVRSTTRFLLSILVTLVILSINPRVVPAQTDSGSPLFYTGEKDYPPMPQGTAVAELSSEDTAVSLTPLSLTANTTSQTSITLHITTLPPYETDYLRPFSFVFELTEDILTL